MVPEDEYEAWPGILGPCRKSSRRGDGVTSIVSLCSFPQAPSPLRFGYLIRAGLWPDSTNHHVGIVWAFCIVCISRKLCQTSNSASRHGRIVSAIRGDAGIHPVRNDPEGEGRWPRPPCA